MKKRSLIKNIEQLKSVTSGRHSASPGQNATNMVPHSAPPKNIPHIRADTQSELNFKMEKSSAVDEDPWTEAKYARGGEQEYQKFLAQEDNKVLMFFYAQKKTSYQPPKTASDPQEAVADGILYANSQDGYMKKGVGKVKGEVMNVDVSELASMDSEERQAGYVRSAVMTDSGVAYAYIYSGRPPVDAVVAREWPPSMDENNTTEGSDEVDVHIPDGEVFRNSAWQSQAKK